MRFLVCGLLIMAACGADDGAVDGGTDAGEEDSALPDSTPSDVPPDVPVDAGPTHCGDQLIISDINPMESVTIYNPTAEDIELSGTGWVLCQRPNYFLLNVIESGVTIGANASHTFDLPAGFFDQDDDAGEIALYEAGAFGNPDAMSDFICWGTGRADSRLSVAEEAGLWSGECAPAITGDSLKRIAMTSGADAASYDATGATADLSCP